MEYSRLNPQNCLYNIKAKFYDCWSLNVGHYSDNITLFIYSIKKYLKYLFSTFNVLDTFLGTGDRLIMHKTVKISEITYFLENEQ